MSKVTSDMSMSLDGFIAGPNSGVEHPLGVGGERLHKWIYDLASFHERHSTDPRTRKPFPDPGKMNRDNEVLGEMFKNVGAIVMGRRMYDTGEGPWGDNPPFHMPVFVLTHTSRKKLVKEGGTTFTFVTDDIENVVKQAKKAAGNKDISIAGGANAVQQSLKAGILDEIRIHLVPVLLGVGIRLFDNSGAGQIELEKTRVIDSPGVTHLTFRVVK